MNKYNRNLEILINRKNLFYDAYSQIMNIIPFELKKNLMFGEKEVSIFRIYGHLSDKLDVFFIILAILGSAGSGLSLPIMAYISSDLMGDIGNTSEYSYDIMLLMERVKRAFDKQINRFLYFGAIAFACNFLSICF